VTAEVLPPRVLLVAQPREFPHHVERRTADDQPTWRVFHGGDPQHDRRGRLGCGSGVVAPHLLELPAQLPVSGVGGGRRRSAGEEVRGVPAHLQVRHAHAEPFDLHRQRVAHGVERRLAGAVEPDGRHPAAAAHRRDLQQPAVALQVGQHGLGDPHRAEEVDVEVRPDLFFGGLFDHAVEHHPGVVDDDVEAAEDGGRALHRGEHGAAVGHVQRKVDEPTRVRVGEGAFGAGRGDHAVPGFQRGFGDRPAQAARSPGDEPDPAVGRRHGPPP
jgi:hypothetical protein